MTRSKRPYDLAATTELARLAEYVVPFAIRAVCELGIPDRLTGGPRSVEDVAREVGAHPPALARALRLLATRDVFEEPAPEVFGLSRLGELLVSDHPLSLRATYCAPDSVMQACVALGHSLRTGTSAFEEVHGETMWDHLARRPEESARFDAVMQGLTQLELRAAVRAYPWDDVTTVVDVGGGNGAFLAGLLARWPHLQGTLFDLPHVLDGAAQVLEGAGIGRRCRVVPGSFLDDPIPAGADLYLLKRVLYSWDDDRAATILRAVRQAMRPDSRVVVLEPLADQPDPMQLSMDLLMLVLSAGGARTRHALAELLSATGLRLVEVRPTLLFPLVVGEAF